MSRSLLVVAVVLASSCAHQAPPPAKPVPSPPPKGDLLRFKAKAGEDSRSKVKLLIEQEMGTQISDKKPAKPVILQFSFGEEEHVETVSPDGAELVTARIVDAVGRAGGGADQRRVDDLALALDELKVQFKRHPRGEVVALALSGLRRPLDESTARQVLNALYGAQRGQLFPESHIDVGGSWKVTLAMPATTGYTGEVSYDFTYARKAGSIATIDCDGRADGKKGDGSGRLTSKSTSEYRFDVDSGHLVGSTVDQLTQAEGTAAGAPALSAVRQHLRVEWTLEGEGAEAREKQE
jgi:hypothetical protein